MEFSKLRKRIIDELKKRKHLIDEEVTLIDGFFDMPIYNDFSWNITVWWKTISMVAKTIPMVALVSNDSWRVYFFAVKWLIDNI